MSPFEEKLLSLPPELRQEVADFVDFLLNKRSRVKRNRLSQEWAGALSKFKGKYTSLKLQEQSLAWRGD